MKLLRKYQIKDEYGNVSDVVDFEFAGVEHKCLPPAFWAKAQKRTDEAETAKAHIAAAPEREARHRAQEEARQKLTAENARKMKEAADKALAVAAAALVDTVLDTAKEP